MASKELDFSFKRPIDAPALLPETIPDGVQSLYEHVHGVALPRGDLRRGQAEALVETVNFLQSGGRVAYVEQVSGYGKSRYMEEVGEGFGGRQLYITPGETGSSNIAGKLMAKDVGRYDKEHKEFGHDITIATMPILERLFNRVASGRDNQAIRIARQLFAADLIFADEVHHYLTPKALSVLTTFLRFNPNSVMLGATATEGYDADKNAEKLFGACLHRVSLGEAVDEGVLLSPRVRMVKTGVSLDKSKTLPSGTIVFDRTVPVRTRDKKLLEAWQDAQMQEGRRIRTVSYLSSVDHATSFLKLCDEMGITAEMITGDTNGDVRRSIYERLEAGKLDTVATVETAIESLDLPWLDGIIVSAQTRSMRVARQMFPRAMRNAKGKRTPWIFQAVDEGTLYRNRPLLVTDILGVTKFVNGEVVKPERQTSYDHSILGLEKGERYGYAPGEGVMDEGVTYEVSSEIIDVNSLFRMGVLDKAKLMYEGLLSKEEEKRLFGEMKRGLEKVLDTQYMSTIAAMKLFDEASGEYVTYARIMKTLFNIEMTEQVNSGLAEHFLKMLRGEVKYEPGVAFDMNINKPWGKEEDANEGILLLPGAHKSVGNVGAFLERVFINAERGGWDIESALTMSSFPIRTSQYTGNLVDLLRLLTDGRIARRDGLTLGDLKSLYARAGFGLKDFKAKR